MIRDITLGQYYAKDSVIHRLDPRVKITGTFAYLVLLFLIKDFIGFGFVVLCLAGLIAASGVPFRFIMRGMKPIMFILVFQRMFYCCPKVHSKCSYLYLT